VLGAALQALTPIVSIVAKTGPKMRNFFTTRALRGRIPISKSEGLTFKLALFTFGTPPIERSPKQASGDTRWHANLHHDTDRQNLLFCAG
jgi:hypothetical protein